MNPKTGVAAWIRTTISSLTWNLYIADCILYRITFYKRPNH